ncbi:Uncharacterised protein [Mycobacteroides abscessus subsp. abscessus]|nr:Uncharacterised protein [Mycobacteroides abscessus subsp. abscessus]
MTAQRYHADISPLSSSPGYPCPISDPRNSRCVASRTNDCVFAWATLPGVDAWAYMNGMWCAGWLERASMPMRVSRASRISWITTGYDPRMSALPVSGVAQNSPSFFSSAVRPPCSVASPSPSWGAVNAVPQALVSV